MDRVGKNQLSIKNLTTRFISLLFIIITSGIRFGVLVQSSCLREFYLSFIQFFQKVEY